MTQPTTRSEELAPCPFPHEVKRGVFVEVDTIDVGFVRVSCSDCGCAGPYVMLKNHERATAKEKAEAIAAWNTRTATPSASVERVASRMSMFLEILSAMGGTADASDGYHNWISAFCEEHEKRDPDTFNEAVNAGYVDWSHDSDTDNSTIRLTDKGRAAIDALAALVPSASVESRSLALLFYDSADQERRLTRLADTFAKSGRVSVINHELVVKDLRAAIDALAACEGEGWKPTDARIKHMVGRFLAWKLPADFNPDGGISIRQVFGQLWPTGTNLFDATQAEAMVRHMVASLPAPLDGGEG